MALWPLGDPEEFRGALRTWLGASWAPTITVRQWWARLASEGLSVPTWAATFGEVYASVEMDNVGGFRTQSRLRGSPGLHWNS